MNLSQLIDEYLETLPETFPSKGLNGPLFYSKEALLLFKKWVEEKESVE